jgi:hypothetical protein
LLVDQSASDFDVERERRTGTHLGDPMYADLVRKISEPESRNVNRVSFTGQSILHKITHTTGTMKLEERLAGVEVYLAMSYVRPLMAIPSVPLHGSILLREVSATLVFREF